MKTISFTSGEILDIISALEAKEDHAYYVQNDPHLAAYYMRIVNQFQRVYDLIQEKVPENRVAHLILS